MTTKFGFLSALKSIHFNSGPFALIYIDLPATPLGFGGGPPFAPVSISFSSSAPSVYPSANVISNENTVTQGKPITGKFWVGPSLTTVLDIPKPQPFMQQVIGMNLSNAPTKTISFKLTITASFEEYVGVGLLTLKQLKSTNFVPPIPSVGLGSESFEFTYPGTFGPTEGNIEWQTFGFPDVLVNVGGADFAQVVRSGFSLPAINGTIDTDTLEVTLA